MLRHGHRSSKDIDIFVPDAQYLAYVNPARNAVAESISRDYFESAGNVKLVLGSRCRAGDAVCQGTGPRYLSNHARVSVVDSTDGTMCPDA
jgi:hypothetical protein